MAVNVLGTTTVLHRLLLVVGLLLSIITRPQTRLVVGASRPLPREGEHRRNTRVLIRSECNPM